MDGHKRDPVRASRTSPRSVRPLYERLYERREQPIRVCGRYLGILLNNTHDDVHRRQIRRPAKRLSDHSFSPIASNGPFYETLRDDHAQPRQTSIVRSCHQPQCPPADSHRGLAEYRVEIAFTLQALRAPIPKSGRRHLALGKRSTHCRAGGSHDPRGLVTLLHRLATGPLDCQSLATLGPPCAQNLAAIFGGHPGTKSMPTFAFDYAGLIGPFHSLLRLRGWEGCFEGSAIVGGGRSGVNEFELDTK